MYPIECFDERVSELGQHRRECNDLLLCTIRDYGGSTMLRENGRKLLKDMCEFVLCPCHVPRTRMWRISETTSRNINDDNT